MTKILPYAAMLAQLGDTRVVGPLIKALGDKDTTVRSNAVKALAQLVGHAVNSVT
ncbi:MAG: HEAT repeat domain-containing protein [gamma proteobacterium endosymbiont of Lamellibrachia anaximandri]|nr:HEAT repeat domain-containing protein [gamma proteobacterium endosymbiont of Lamellibrachia anaximandri]MBL3619343.1 HEAT repeat domain-containing protein [gamma proteobacterium endosymbiont of Lamellibrachia anaximandri]